MAKLKNPYQKAQALLQRVYAFKELEYHYLNGERDLMELSRKRFDKLAVKKAPVFASKSGLAQIRCCWNEKDGLRFSVNSGFVLDAEPMPTFYTPDKEAAIFLNKEKDCFMNDKGIFFVDSQGRLFGEFW